jgi:hypothetical protein
MLRWSHLFVDWLPTTIGSLHIKCPGENEANNQDELPMGNIIVNLYEMYTINVNHFD